MFKNPFARRRNVSTPAPSRPATQSAKKYRILNINDVPTYMPERLAALHEVYAERIRVLENSDTLAAGELELWMASTEYILNQRIVALERPELQYLLGDRSVAGRISALRHLDEEAVSCLSRFKSSGEIASMKIWS
jgi:hypothetical protein